MKKEEFFDKLEYLLQDIPDEEREDALNYYRDYLMEAGSENEEQAIREFGSPERVAAMIRADLSGNLKEGGSFTETGYEDERFRDPNYQMVKRLDLPEEQESAGSAGYDSQDEGYTYEKKKPWTNKPLKVLLWVILLIAGAPFLLGAAGAAAGVLISVVSLIFAAILAITGLTAAAFIVGVCLVGLAVAFVFSTPIDGIFLFGAAVVGIGFGIIGIVLLYGFCCMLLPLFWKGIKMAAGFISRAWKGVGKA